MRRANPLLALLLVAGAATAQPGKQLQMKLDYAKGVVLRSQSALRVENSNNAEAKAKLEEVRSLYRQARAAAGEGREEEAERLVNKALRQMPRVAQMVPNRATEREQAHKRYEELMRQVETFYSWGSDYGKRQKGEDAVAAALDTHQVKAAMADARRHAAANDYPKANVILERLLNDVINTANQAIGKQTITYDLNFATSADEYRYELTRNREFERLVPLAIAQRRPSAGVRSLMSRFVEKALRLRQEAEEQLKEEQFAAAIKSLQDSSAQFRNALKIAGVPVNF